VTLQELPITDTRSLFRPVSVELVALLRMLPDEAWTRRTVAGTWRVRDVVAHLLDGTIRRLGFHRDGHPPPAPSHSVTSERELAVFLNRLNAEWITATQRISPRLLTDLFDETSARWAIHVEHLPLDGRAPFPVSWAGDADYASDAWFDLGREFTELVHHQAQIRDAVGAAPLDNFTALRAFFEIAVRGLPHALRGIRRPGGDTLTLEIAGPAGGTWTLRQDADRWTLWLGDTPAPTARAVISVDNAWRLLFNGLSPEAAANAFAIEGDHELAAALFTARSVVV
jgi:hypothetical protein